MELQTLRIIIFSRVLGILKNINETNYFNFNVDMLKKKIQK